MSDLSVVLSGVAQVFNSQVAPAASHQKSATAAAEEILRQNPKVRVLGFGEVNSFKSHTVKYTVERFADEILPLLARKGFKDLVLEAVLTDAAVEKDLKYFYRTGNLGFLFTPKLNRCLNGRDYNGYVKLLKKARKLGVKVHPGGMAWAEAQATIFRSTYSSSLKSSSLALAKRAAIYNGRAIMKAVKKVNGLSTAGKRVAFYAGYLHNNVRAQNNTGFASSIYLGIPLRSKLGNAYAEVDLFVPYAVRKEGAAPYIGLQNWSKYVPRGGANLLKMNNGRYVILYP